MPNVLLWWRMGYGEAVHVCRQGEYGNFLKLPFNFAKNLKVLKKIKALKKNGRHMEAASEESHQDGGVPTTFCGADFKELLNQNQWVKVSGR